MKKFICIFMLCMLVGYVFADEIITGNEYSFIRYNENILCDTTLLGVQAKVLEIFPVSANTVKVTICVPVNKAGAYNSFVLYLEKGTKLHVSKFADSFAVATSLSGNDLLNISAKIDEKSSKYLVAGFSLNKLILQSE